MARNNNEDQWRVYNQKNSSIFLQNLTHVNLDNLTFFFTVIRWNISTRFCNSQPLPTIECLEWVVEVLLGSGLLLIGISPTCLLFWYSYWICSYKCLLLYIYFWNIKVFHPDSSTRFRMYLMIFVASSRRTHQPVLRVGERNPYNILELETFLNFDVHLGAFFPFLFFVSKFIERIMWFEILLWHTQFPDFLICRAFLCCRTLRNRKPTHPILLI